MTASRSREDVIFSFEAFKKHQPAAIGAITATSSRRRRPASARSPSPSIAPGNRELPQIVGQLNVLPKHWWEGTDAQGKQARHRRDHARAAARLRRLPDQGVRRRPHRSSTSACRTIGARTSTSMSAATISTRCATNISATRRSRSKPSRPISSTGAPRTAPRTGRPPTTSRRVQDKRVDARGIRRSAARGVMQAFVLQHCAATSSRIRACAAPSTTPSISRR